jgi:squalene-hopene/tetraprenyl-beta-curcumene cyclase
VPAGLVELAGDDRLLEPLVQVIDAFNQAAQMWDDLQDWRDDLRHGIPSLLVGRIAAEPPPRDLDAAAWKALGDRLARDVYYGGHAFHVIDLALAALDRAEALKPTISNLAWHDTTAIYRRRFTSLRGDIERIVRENVARARQPPAIELHLPSATSPWQALACDAVQFLARQWQLGFGEARDMMRYPKELRIGPAEKYYFGDVFQRALIADALCDANPMLDGQLDELLQGEARYLLAQKLSTCRGGWSYFPDQVHLPPDADDLAQIMQVLLRTGHRGEVVARCEEPLGILLRDCAHPDGSFETWIVPAAERTPLEVRHAELVQSLWGAGADCDVMPNVLSALHAYAPERFAATIARGRAYLLGQQRDDGTWPGRWYHGAYYPLYVNLRLLAEVGAPPDQATAQKAALARGLRYLRRSQRGDGGYGLEAEAAPSDALGTALGLLGLAAAHGEAGDEAGADHERAARARQLLERHRQDDRGWPAQRFLPKGFGAYHGSRTMTTLFVLKAALAWHALANRAARR